MSGLIQKQGFMLGCVQSIVKSSGNPMKVGKYSFSFVDRFRQGESLSMADLQVAARRAFSSSVLLRFQNSIESCQQSGWTIICDGNSIWFNPTV